MATEGGGGCMSTDNARDMQSAVGAECSSSPVAVPGTVSRGRTVSAAGGAASWPGAWPGRSWRARLARRSPPTTAGRRKPDRPTLRRAPVEQITCPDPFGLGFQELAPGRAVAPGCGIQAGSVEDVTYHTGPAPIQGPRELAADPLVSPGGVLARQAQHRGADVCPGEGAAWTFPRIGPRAGDQVRGASAAGSPGHEEVAPRRARQQPRQRSQQHPIPSLMFGLFAWRGGTATWWRSAMISISLARSPRPVKTMSWKMRWRARYSKDQNTNSEVALYPGMLKPLTCWSLAGQQLRPGFPHPTGAK